MAFPAFARSASVGLLVLLLLAARTADAQQRPGKAEADNQTLRSHPQWTTTSRLFKPGEAIQFQFTVPAGTEASDLTIFPRYLERAKPGDDFDAGALVQRVFATLMGGVSLG